MRAKFVIFLVTALAVFAAETPTPCVFCAIASGDASQSVIVYRDELVVAFMDRAPRNPGHVLIVPILHANDLLDVPPATLARIAQVAQRIAQAIKTTDLRAEGFNIQSNTGKVAGQAVFHLHVHVIPRFTGDAPVDSAETRLPTPVAELEVAAGKIRDALKKKPNPERSVSP